MNAAHFHLMVNHLPVLGVLFGALLLLFAIARQREQVARAALGVLVLAAVAAVPTFLSGEPAEKVVEHMAGVTESAIERHEDLAKGALAATIVSGLLAGALLAMRREHLGRAATMSALVVALGASLLMGWTAYLGGQIHHTEIGSPPAATQSESD